MLASNATIPAPLLPSLPPILAMTRPFSTSGDPAAPKKPLRTLKRCIGIDVPDLLARRQVDRGELAFRSEGVDTTVGDDGYGAWSLVKTEVVSIGRRISVAPLAFSCTAVKRLDDLLVLDAVKQN